MADPRGINPPPPATDSCEAFGHGTAGNVLTHVTLIGGGAGVGAGTGALIGGLQRVARDKSALDDLACALVTLKELGVDLIEVFGVHSKILMADDDLFCAGSFNWFSAARDGAYARHETSLAYHGPAVAREIEAMKASLHKRIAH